MFTRYFFLLLTSVSLTLLSQTKLFAQVAQVSVSMNGSDFLNLFRRDIFSKDFLPAVIGFDGKIINDASIRFKGSTTPYYPKKPFKIKFKKKTSTSDFIRNLHHINLNPMFTDKSYLREKTTWELFADMSGLGPKVFGYANLTVNSIYSGLYLIVQPVDEEFLKFNGLPEGNLYEAEENRSSADLSIQPESVLKKNYDNKNDDASDYSDLEDLIKIINETSDNEFPNMIKEVFDINSIYNWFALNVLTQMGDTYVKNYFLYHNPSKSKQSWRIIPWDYDLSFGRDGDSSKPYPSDLLNDIFSYSYEPLSGPDNVLKRRIISNQTLASEFRQHLDNIIQNYFTEGHIYPRIDSDISRIKEYAEHDPMKWGTYKDFEEQSEALKYFVTARRNFLITSFINQRKAENDEATVQINEAGVPYNFVDGSGKLIATMWLNSLSNLENLRIKVYPSQSPPSIPDAAGQNYVRRYIEITSEPPNAKFSAKLRWGYLEFWDEYTEIRTGIRDEHLLECFNYKQGEWVPLSSEINTYSNTVTVSGIDQTNCGPGKYFALMMPNKNEANWQTQKNNYWHHWYDVKFSDTQNGFITGDDGTVLKTTDGGSTWTQRYLGIHVTFRRLAAASSTILFAAGQNGSVYKSTTSGTYWLPTATGTTNNINDIVFTSSQTGWCAANRGIILITVNGGTTWQTKLIDNSKDIYAIESLNENELIAAGSGGAIYKSVNKGQSWSPVTGPNDKNINRLVKGDNSNIWGACDGGILIHSTDAGSTWSEIKLDTEANIEGMTIKESELCVSGYGGKIFKSENGVAWSEESTEGINDLYGITFAGSSGIALGNGGVILLRVH